jgi:hypothetical protein
VPQTLGGKILTVIYALCGVPVFMWYIIKLGATFRVLVILFVRNFADCIKYSYAACSKTQERKQFRLQMQHVIATVSRPVIQVINGGNSYLMTVTVALGGNRHLLRNGRQLNT